MARGNKLLNRLVKLQEGQPHPASAGSAASAVRVKGAGRVTVVQVADRAIVLVSLTLVSGIAAWSHLSEGSLGTDSWPAREANLAGLAGFVVVTALLIYGALKPVRSAIAGAVYAVAQGLLFAWVSIAFEVAIPGLPLNALLATVLTGLAALVVRRSTLSARPAVLQMAAASGAGFVALVLINVSAAAMSVDLGFFGLGDEPPPWHVWLVAVILIGCTAYSFNADLRVVEALSQSGAPSRHAWAGALGVAAGLVGMYGWHLFDFRGEGADYHSSSWGTSDQDTGWASD